MKPHFCYTSYHTNLLIKPYPVQRHVKRGCHSRAGAGSIAWLQRRTAAEERSLSLHTERLYYNTSAMEIFGQNNYFYVLTRLISNYISLSPRWQKKYFSGTRQFLFSSCVAGAWDYLKERGPEGDMPPLRLPLSSSACYAGYRRKRELSTKRGLGFPSVKIKHTRPTNVVNEHCRVKKKIQ